MRERTNQITLTVEEILNLAGRGTGHEQLESTRKELGSSLESVCDRLEMRVEAKIVSAQENTRSRINQLEKKVLKSLRWVIVMWSITLVLGGVVFLSLASHT